LVDWKVPRRKRSYWTNRLLDFRLHHICKTWWNDTPIAAPGFFCKPVDQVTGRCSLGTSFRQRLTLLNRQQARNALATSPKNVCSFAQQLVTIKGRYLAPNLKATLGCSQS